MSGRSTLELKARELGIDVDGKVLSDVVDTLKRLEHEGYHFEAADASLELLMRSRGRVGSSDYFRVESFKVVVSHRSGDDARTWNDLAVEAETDATVKMWVGDERLIASGEGNGPVNALDEALAQGDRAALPAAWPTCTSPTSRCGCSTPTRAPAR